jgi:hypothetical protein
MDEVIPIFCEEYKEKAEVRINPPRDGSNVLEVTTWPYALTPEPGSPERPGLGFSASTHCMILFALDALVPRDKAPHSVLVGPRFRPRRLSAPGVEEDAVRKVVERARRELFEAVKARASEVALFTSSSFGENDPFTLTWLTELFFRGRPSPEVVADEDLPVCAGILNAVGEAMARSGILESKKAVGDSKKAVGEFREVRGSFLKLRQLHLALAAARLAEAAQRNPKHGVKPGVEPRTWLAKTDASYRDYDATVHRQLSYFAMRDSQFDPAELAFALEAALLLHGYWLGRATVDQAFEALSLSRDRQSLWRPVSPFLANDRGHALFPVSVEVANSILRSCEILDRDEATPKRFAQIEPQLRIYANWILGEAERVPVDGKVLVGWRSEYAEKRGMIHVWLTSHVLVFLAHYESLLKRKIGADGIEAAGLTVQVSRRKIEGFWWDSEPLRGLSEGGKGRYAVLGRLWKQYLEPRTATSLEQNLPHSVLLYGPPGTGKTTIAEQMAAELRLPLIVVTVSDFLAAGSGELENRAKGVFDVLRSQEGVVILFDEIDQFLLDRNSDFYQRQSDVFKFMTPGMLTKLQNLRDDASCVFLIATNYYERIDGAIKRRGRVDDHLLVSLPDRAQRTFLIGDFLRRLFKGRLADQETLKTYEASAITDEAKACLESWKQGKLPPNFEEAITREKLGEKTVLLGWGDLKWLVETGSNLGPDHLTTDSLARALAVAAGRVHPAVSLEGYRSRFEGPGPYPFEEFFLLVYLILESPKALNPAEERAIKAALQQVKAARAEGRDDLYGLRLVSSKQADVLRPVIARLRGEMAPGSPEPSTGAISGPGPA